MTLKKLALATALFTAPFFAQAELQSMDDATLSSVTGQAGISISGNFSGTVGAVVYTDTDCVDCSVRMENVSITGLNILDTAPVTVDVIDGGAVGKQIAIGLPAMSGGMTIGAVKVGDTTAASIGSVGVENINFSGSTIKVWGH
ncbi:DUF6160 family protein [Atopomonas sediminilitoris]|uniref:DUF6160 family protein n=1 Tax=Atopomonas sediminilitoris TaxID=2919919 RepID=UPI001F4E489C|nr:DUF6160 family protein [Atopomonas sediminilitoris]MCJ8168564.1 DUF6160 family protein [Atopomonas sediminilitoris]